MIVALDIETIGNSDVAALLPEPEVKTGNIKDPAKIAEKIAEAKARQIADMALDPLTGRICCYAAVGMNGDEAVEHAECIDAATDDAETAIVQSLMRVMGTDEIRLVTWNGANFDLPYIYKRAMILGVNPADFGAPPLTTWTKRYSTERHYDLMQVWSGFGAHDYTKLDTVAGLVLRERKTEIDVTTFADLLLTADGRAKIAEYCTRDTALTWRLWERFNGFLFV